MTGFSEPHKGLVFALLAAVFFTCLDISIRFSGSELTVWHLVFGRSLFGVAAMWLLARKLGVELLGKRRGELVVVGLTGMAGASCLTWAIMRIPLFEALVLLYLFPVFAALFSPYLTGERPRGVEWLFIFLAFCGIVLMLWRGQGMVGMDWGHVAGFFAAVFIGLSMTMTRRVRVENNSLTPFFYISVVGCILAPIPLFLQDAPLFPEAGWGWAGLPAVCLFMTAAHLSNNKALGSLPSSTVGVITMLEAVLGAFVGWVIWSEPLGTMQFVGAAVVLGSGVALTLRPGLVRGGRKEPRGLR
jgi:drug/metabolite transporter (DMT)-like permease